MKTSVFRRVCSSLKFALALSGAVLVILWVVVGALVARNALAAAHLTGTWESAGAQLGTWATQPNFVMVSLHADGTGFAQIEFSPNLSPNGKGEFVSYYSDGIRWARRSGDNGVVVLTSVGSDRILGTLDRVGRSEATLHLRSPDATIKLKRRGIAISRLFGD